MEGAPREGRAGRLAAARVSTARLDDATADPLHEISDRNGDAGERRRRSAAEIEAELSATTDRLAANVDALVDRLHPKAIAGRGVTTARQLITSPSGRPRADVIGAAIGAAAGIAIIVWLARRRR